jgi:hypothetical protein
MTVLAGAEDLAPPQPPPGFNPRTHDPVAGHYIGYNIAAHQLHKYGGEKSHL